MLTGSLAFNSMASSGNTLRCARESQHLTTGLQQGGNAEESMCPSLPKEIWEKVARKLQLAADRARLCMAFKCLCRPGHLKACLMLYMAERLKQQRQCVVSLAHLPGLPA